VAVVVDGIEEQVVVQVDYSLQLDIQLLLDYRLQ
jgi:hypothetical protein